MEPKYKLKKWVVISVYLLAVGAVVSSLLLVGRILKNKLNTNEALTYVYHGLVEETIPVINYDNNKILKPFDKDNIEILKNYYDKDAAKEDQEKSLIFYQNTYMPNTGILYGAKEEFEVLSVLDGTVADITADEIMGNIITIKHSNNLATIYQCLNEVNVLIGDLVKQGDVLGTSGGNKIESSSKDMLLFEVLYNGEYINPEIFYNMNPAELS